MIFTVGLLKPLKNSENFVFLYSREKNNVREQPE